MYFTLVSIWNIFIFLEQDHISGLHSSTFSRISSCIYVAKIYYLFYFPNSLCFWTLISFNFLSSPGRAVLLLFIPVYFWASEIKKGLQSYTRVNSRVKVSLEKSGGGSGSGGNNGASAALPQSSISAPILKYGQLLFRQVSGGPLDKHLFSTVALRLPRTLTRAHGALCPWKPPTKRPEGVSLFDIGSPTTGLSVMTRWTHVCVIWSFDGTGGVGTDGPSTKRGVPRARRSVSSPGSLPGRCCLWPYSSQEAWRAPTFGPIPGFPWVSAGTCPPNCNLGCWWFYFHINISLTKTETLKQKTKTKTKTTKKTLTEFH